MTDAERTQFIRRTPPVPPVPAEAYDDDRDRRNGWLWAAIVLALLVVLGGAIAAFLLLRDNGSQPPQVAVPNLIGSTPAAAQQEIAGKQLTLAPATPATTAGPCDNGSTVDAGTICKLLQGNQTVGATVAAGSTLRYQLYQPGKIPVPNVVSLRAKDAEDQLNAANLKYREKLYNSAAEAGTVQKQSPAPYVQVAGGTTVTLYVSTGKVRLKDVVGEPVDRAVADLNKLQFANVDTSQTVRTTVQSKDGTVASESPAAGTWPPDTKITLAIYKYVPPPPTSSAPPTTSAPPSSSASSGPSPSGSTSHPSGAATSGGQGIAPPVSTPSPTVSSGSGH